MDLRQFFTNHTWWGKLIGAFFGFLIAGATGALVGLLIGNFFDKGLSLHFSHPFWYYQSEKNPTVKTAFFESTFCLLGHIAKADGQVSQESIAYANHVIAQMQLNTKNSQLARHFFVQGKSQHFKLSQQLTALYQAIQHKPQLIHLFVDTQYQLIKIIGISEKKVAIMNEILSYLQLAPLYQNRQFAYDFPWYTSRREPPNYHQYQQQNHSYQRDSASSYQQSVYDPYALLDITSTATKAEVKRAYRRQISRYHPDKLIAKGASDHSIKVATEKTQQIRKAYEHICASNGW